MNTSPIIPKVAEAQAPPPAPPAGHDGPRPLVDQLRDSEARYRQIVEMASEGIWQVDAQWRTVFVNTRMAEMLGHRVEAMVGMHVGDFMDDDARAQFESEQRGKRESLVSSEYDFRWRRRDGSDVWTLVSARPLVDGEGRFAGSLAMVTDITEHRRAAQALRESERRLGQIVEHLPVGTVYVHDETLTLNRAAEHITGYTRHELATVADWFARLHGDATAAARAHYARPAGPLTIRRKDGSERLIDVTLCPLEGAAMWLIHDVTESHRLAESDRRQSAEAMHISQLITAGELASGMAHELNQPLGAIANFSEACLRLLARRENIPGEVTQMLRDIAAESVRAGQVIHTLRTLTQKREPRREPVDICEVIRSSTRLMQPDSRAHKVDIQVELPAPAVTVEADGVQLMQVVLNLMRNALEAICEGPAAVRRVHVVCCDDEQQVAVTVRDTGPGLSSALQEKLFEPFYTTKPRGLGMGLHICRSIIDSHGGRIWATPGPEGRGAEFHIRLPRGRFAAGS